jgi:signal transduction histidine kinase/Tfp pilus assembly protein PilF
MKVWTFKFFPVFVLFLLLAINSYSIRKGQDTTHIDYYLQQAKKYTSIKPDSAVIMYKKAIRVSRALKNKKEEGKVHQDFGIFYRNRGNYDSAQIHFNLALNLYRSVNDTLGIAKAINNKGTVYFFTGKFKSAIQKYQKAVRLFRKMKYKKGIADCNNNIGIIHWRQNNLERAKEYLKEAAKDYKEIGNKTMQGYAYNNLGVIYGEENNYNTSLKYHQKAAKIFKKLDLQQLIQNTYQNLGIVNKSLGNYNKAMEYYNKSLNIAEKYNNKKLIASIHGNMSELYKAMADKTAKTRTQRKSYLKKAIEEGENAIDVSREIGAIPLLNSNAETQKNVYKKAGDYKRALAMAELYIETQDSLYSKEKTKAVEELEAEYQSEKKQLRIDKLEKEKALQKEKMKNQRFLIYTFISGLVLILLFFVIIYRQKQKQKKANYLLSEKNEEIQKQKESLAEQAEELRTLNATKNKFFSIIAHDLKNPFNYLLGYSGLLLDDWDSMEKEKIKTFVSDIHKASQRGYDLLVNLLEWSRAQTGKLELHPANLELYDIIQQTIFQLKPNADEKNINIENNIEPDVFIYADMNSVTTTIRNLFSNAIKYTQKGGTVKFYNLIEENFVKIFIEDNGSGISPENQEKIFRIDETFSNKGTGGEKGTGLGLLLCKEFVEMNGGIIGFESEENKGTTFYFTLPKVNLQS